MNNVKQLEIEKKTPFSITLKKYEILGDKIKCARFIYRKS